jgi:hypothetical protein
MARMGREPRRPLAAAGSGAARSAARSRLRAGPCPGRRWPPCRGWAGGIAACGVWHRFTTAPPPPHRLLCQIVQADEERAPRQHKRRTEQRAGAAERAHAGHAPARRGEGRHGGARRSVLARGRAGAGAGGAGTRSLFRALGPPKPNGRGRRGSGLGLGLECRFMLVYALRHRRERRAQLAARRERAAARRARSRPGRRGARARAPVARPTSYPL